MNRTIDVDALMVPIAGDNPVGESLRYTLYSQVEEARRADDTYDRGDWDRELKSADWDAVIDLCLDALTNKTKDLQLAAWLTEALAVAEGFDGLLTGLKVFNGYLVNFWDHVYPEIEDGDLDFRTGRIEFLNNSLSSKAKQVAVTDGNAKAGYSWNQWQESRRVGYEADARDPEARSEMISDGKLTAEDFDDAVNATSKSYYEFLANALEQCLGEFKFLDEIADEKFGTEAPRLNELRTAINDCSGLVFRILKQKKELEPDPDSQSEPEPEIPPSESTGAAMNKPAVAAVPEIISDSVPQIVVKDSGSRENSLWTQAKAMLKTAGINQALNLLLQASSSAPSVRERNRYRLLMAKLCLQADRPDLAHPIVEELNSLIEELNLERWESPRWIAEILDALYRCLTTENAANDDPARAEAIFQKICTLDVTKAMTYRQ